METMIISKSEVTDQNSLELLLSLYDCHIASVEDTHYIIEGTSENIEEFRYYWS